MYKQHLNKYEVIDEGALKEYCSFIDSIEKVRDVLVNGHHILPQCTHKEFEFEDWNIVNLTPREHLYAHYLLGKAYGGKLLYAFKMMANLHKNEEYNLEDVLNKYQALMELAYSEHSDRMKGSGNPMHGSARFGSLNPMYGKKHSEEAKLAVSIKNKEFYSKEENRLYGERNGMYGKTHTEEVRKAISERFKGEKNHNYGKPKPDHIRKAISESSMGKIITQEHRDNISKANKGKKKPPEHGKKLSETRKNLRRLNLVDGGFKYVHKDDLQSYPFRDGKYWDR